MGKRRYPPISPSEVKAIVLALGFRHKRTQGSHEHYEREATDDLPRKIVTIDMHYDEFDDDLIKSMIAQSGYSRDKFYGATKHTARKGGVLYLAPTPRTTP
jgi:predicted RNA binding protein YcfA (HicA-like mRNA interferase family)